MDALRRRQKIEQVDKPIPAAEPAPPVKTKKRKAKTAIVDDSTPSLASTTTGESSKKAKVGPSPAVERPSSSTHPATTPHHSTNHETEAPKPNKDKDNRTETDGDKKQKKKDKADKGKAREVEPAAPLPPPPAAPAAAIPTAVAPSLLTTAPKKPIKTTTTTSTSSAERALSSLEGLIKMKPPKPVKPACSSGARKGPSKKPSTSSKKPKVGGGAGSTSAADFVAAHFKDESDEDDELISIDAIARPVTDADHQAILSSKWIPATQLNKLAQDIGLKFKKGAYSTAEEKALQRALGFYKQVHRIDDAGVAEIVFCKGKGNREQHAAFFSEITAQVPFRPLISVYHHVRRLYHPMKGQGRWSNEEDAALRAAVMTMGQSWELVSPIVGRSGFDCRDRYRNHLEHNEGGDRNQGPWSAEEERELLQVVHAQQIATGVQDIDDVVWAAVAEKMGHKRSRAQCRQKWNDTVSMQAQKGGLQPTWTETDSYLLVQKIQSLDVAEEQDINYSALRDDDWNFWPPKILKAKLRQFIDRIPNHRDLKFRDLAYQLTLLYPRPLDAQLSAGSSIPKPGARARKVEETM